MDTSKEYIAMCDCKEIQNLMPDCVLNNRISGIPYEVCYGNGCNFWAMKDKVTGWFIWLPRQDQLQEMMHGEDYLDDYELSKDFVEYIEMTAYNRETIEQLWLAFVMKEKHNKTWNGEEWT